MENKPESALDAAAIAQILEQHKAWIASNGREGCQANLSGANLLGADLSGADLRRANLVGADLAYASLIGADLRGASLFGASLDSADLRGAELVGANLSGASLFGASLDGADMRRANLRGALGFSVVADAPGRLLAVARAALADDSSLYMGQWHTCETTHCIAGWAIHQAGELGRLLERLHGPEVAGRILLGHEAAMHFHDGDIDARVWLQSVLNAAEADQSVPAANS